MAVHGLFTAARLNGASMAPETRADLLCMVCAAVIRPGRERDAHNCDPAAARGAESVPWKSRAAPVTE
jgi:hypothetical protein